MTLARRALTGALLTATAVLAGLGAATLIQWGWEMRQAFNEWDDSTAGEVPFGETGAEFGARIKRNAQAIADAIRWDIDLGEEQS